MSVAIKLQDKDKFERLDRFINEQKDKKGPLMPVLQKAQEIFGYLPIELQNHIAEALGIPLTDVYGVATFYSQFSLTPKGEYHVGVCMGTACYVRGAQKILDEFAKILDVKVGGTTNDGKFTLEATRCLGACGLAPVIMINDEVYGRLVPEDVTGIIDKYKDKQ
jgi:NADH-quinone oxidoreductase E subunit